MRGLADAAGLPGVTIPTCDEVRQALLQLNYGESLYVPFETWQDAHLDVSIPGRTFQRRPELSTREYVFTRLCLLEESEALMEEVHLDGAPFVGVGGLLPPRS